MLPNLATHIHCAWLQRGKVKPVCKIIFKLFFLNDTGKNCSLPHILMNLVAIPPPHPIVTKNFTWKSDCKTNLELLHSVTLDLSWARTKTWPFYIATSFLFGLTFNPEDGGSTFHWKVGFSLNYITQKNLTLMWSSKCQKKRGNLLALTTITLWILGFIYILNIR